MLYFYHPQLRGDAVFTLCACLLVRVCVCVCLCLSRCLSGRFNYEGLVWQKQYFAEVLVGTTNCASYLMTWTISSQDKKSRSNIKIAITWSVFITLHGNKYYHNIWLTGQLSKTPKIIIERKSKPFSGFFKINVLRMKVSISVQTWKLDGKND